MTQPQAGRRNIRHLDLRLAVPDVPVPYMYPVVQILIDGSELFASVQKHRYVGSPPEAILGHDEPLLPVGAPRRVALYGDVCGLPDCGSIAAVISSSRDRVTWTDIAITAGMADAPVLAGWFSAAPAEIPDLEFDERQYTTEVRRAGSAREWESDPWRTALLLDEHIRHEPLVLEDTVDGSMRELGWIEPQGAGSFKVALWDGQLRNPTFIR